MNKLDIYVFFHVGKYTNSNYVKSHDQLQGAFRECPAIIQDVPKNGWHSENSGYRFSPQYHPNFNKSFP